MRALALNVRLGVGIGTTEHKSFEWKGEGFQLGPTWGFDISGKDECVEMRLTWFKTVIVNNDIRLSCFL